MAFSVLVQDGIFPIIHLKDEQYNCSAEVYSFGALLNAFTITRAGTSHNVIDGFATPQDAVEGITAGFKSAKLSPFVCRVTKGQYSFNNQAYSIKKFYLGDEAIHGLLYDAPFSILDKGTNSKGAFVTLGYEYHNAAEGFPFQYKTQITYTLKEHGVLSMETVVTNTGDADMPLCDGWHPYFNLGCTVNDLLVQINATQVLEFNDSLVPTGKTVENIAFATPKHLGDTFFDNCFIVNEEPKTACTLTNTTSGLRVTIEAMAGYPYLQVYTPPHRKSIAVENLSGAPNAFNNAIGLIIAKPSEPHIFANDYTVYLPA